MTIAAAQPPSSPPLFSDFFLICFRLYCEGSLAIITIRAARKNASFCHHSERKSNGNESIMHLRTLRVYRTPAAGQKLSTCCANKIEIDLHSQQTNKIISVLHEYNHKNGVRGRKRGEGELTEPGVGLLSAMYLLHVQMDMVSQPRNKINQSPLAQAPFGIWPIWWYYMRVCDAVSRSTEHGNESWPAAVTHGMRLERTARWMVSGEHDICSKRKYLWYCSCLTVREIVWTEYHWRPACWVWISYQ